MHIVVPETRPRAADAWDGERMVVGERASNEWEPARVFMQEVLMILKIKNEKAAARFG